jgi:DNA excision repair protein ERCC-2
LRRHFAEEPGDYGFLIDEAHNLADRAREMFSADINIAEIRQVRRQIKEALPRCARKLNKLSATMRKLCGTAASERVDASDPATELNLFPERRNAEAVPTSLAESETRGRGVRAPMLPETRGARTSRELPADLLPLVEEALEETEAWLARNEPAEFREGLLELYFRLHSFWRTAELYDERFVTILEPDASVRLFCLDPSFLLGKALARGKAAVFFSATLTPIDYYRDLLGGSPEDPVGRLCSPFPPENLALLVHDRIRTHFKARAGTLGEVAQAIAALVGGRRGNYLVYFPSYTYLNAVREQFLGLNPAARILVQRPGLTEPEREAFLAAFSAEHGETLVGFAVMGGIFGEGIDLAGDRLIGAIIVGVGLPQLCVERDLIRDYFQKKTGAGFDYAYTFPGMNRVLQATGRVIRSETDRGVVALLDTRFGEPRYRQLFPAWWQPVRVRSAGDLHQAVDAFWRRQGGSESPESP